METVLHLVVSHSGVAFKEGFCYNKVEAGGLFGTVPLLLGGHLLQIFPKDVSAGSLIVGRVRSGHYQEVIADHDRPQKYVVNLNAQDTSLFCRKRLTAVCAVYTAEVSKHRDKRTKASAYQRCIIRN